MTALFFTIMNNYDSYTIYTTFEKLRVVDNLTCIFNDKEVETMLKQIDSNREKTLCFQIGGYVGFLHANKGLTMFSFLDVSACSFEDILQDEFVENKNFDAEEKRLLKDYFNKATSFRAANEIFQPVYAP
jgi:hypothetical protein